MQHYSLLLKIIGTLASICIGIQIVLIISSTIDQQSSSSETVLQANVRNQFINTINSIDSNNDTPVSKSNDNTNTNNQQQQEQQEEKKKRQQTDTSNSKQSTTTTTTTNAAETTTIPPDYYIVFSTSCTDQQNWESYLFFYHTYRVKQYGTITRIVSGCSSTEQEQLQQFHTTIIIPSFGSNYYIHFTPDYSHVQLDDHNAPYKYMNKPYGLRHWFDNGPLNLKQYNNTTTTNIPNSILDSIVFLLDPDMILLRPIRHDFTSEEVIFAADDDGKSNDILTKVVRHGYPMSQQDGYLNNYWMSNALNHSYIYSEQKFQPKMPNGNEGQLYWNTGPPYIGTVNDMYRITKLWCQLAPKIVETKPELFSEMYGYILATVQLNLKHTMIKSSVISTTVSDDREGWYYIDQLPFTNELCQVGITATTYKNDNDNNIDDTTLQKTKLPIALHYCSRYILRDQFFSKYRIKKNILDCNKPLLKSLKDLNGILLPKQDQYDIIVPPKADVKDVTKWIGRPEKRLISSRTAKRDAFMICSLTSALNNALRFLKLNTTYCSSSSSSTTSAINLTEAYTVYNSPSNY